MKLFWGFIINLLVGRKNKFKNKFKKTKVKDLNNELLELQVEQDVLLNQIKRWGDRYNSWHKSVLYKESTEEEMELAASRMEICESNKSKLEANLQNSINEVSIIQAAITIKENEAKRRKGFINELYNATSEDISSTLSGFAIISKARKIRMENALDLMTQPLIASRASRTPEFNKNLEKIKESKILVK